MARAPVLRNRSPHSLQGAPRDHTSRKRRPAVSRLRTPARAPSGSTWVVPFVPDPLPTPPPKDDEGSGRWLTRHLKTTASRLGPRVIPPGASQPMLDGAIAQGDPATLRKTARLSPKGLGGHLLLAAHNWGRGKQGGRDTVPVILLGRTLHVNDFTSI